MDNDVSIKNKSGNEKLPCGIEIGVIDELTYFRRWIKSDEKINSLKIYKLFFLDELKNNGISRRNANFSPIFIFRKNPMYK